MNFPTLQEITPEQRSVTVWYNGILQYYITNETEMNNIRLWALLNKQSKNVIFIWQGIEIGLTENGDLTIWPLGLFDNNLKAFANLAFLKRGEPIIGELFIK